MTEHLNDSPSSIDKPKIPEPEGIEPAQSTINAELVKRFSKFFDGVESTSFSQEYGITEPGDINKRRPRKTLIKQDITKQVVAKRVDDKRYLTGFYRNAEWGELTVEHLIEEKYTNAKTGEVREAKPERYKLTFIDCAIYGPGGGIYKETKVGRRVAYSYEFPVSQDDNFTITPDQGAVMRPSDGDYPCFLHALEIVEEILAA